MGVMGVTTALTLATLVGLYGTITADTTWTRPQVGMGWQAGGLDFPKVTLVNARAWLAVVGAGLQDCTERGDAQRARVGR